MKKRLISFLCACMVAFASVGVMLPTPEVHAEEKRTDDNGFVWGGTDGKTIVGYEGRETAITIPEGATAIGYFAFSTRKDLISVKIPNSVTTIGYHAFEDCTGLTSLEIPNSVTTIDELAFVNCTGLTSIVVDKGNKVYDSRNDCNAIIETESNQLIQGCNNTKIPSGVATIGYHAFNYCSGLTNLEIPNSVETIGPYAFDGCSGLTSIEIPNSVKKIEWGAFVNCSGLTSIEIPSSVTTIDEEVFEGCDSLTIYCNANSYAARYAQEHNIRYAPIEQMPSNQQCDHSGKTEIRNAKEATATTAGYTGDTYCKDCGAKISAGKKIPATGVKKNTIVQPVKNTKKADAATYKVTSTSKKTVTYNKTKTTSKKAKVPDKIKVAGKTYKVTAIATNAFKNNKKIQTVTVGKNVTTIGKNAFSGAKKLKSVTINGNSLKKVGKNAFKGVKKNCKITIQAKSKNQYKKIVKMIKKSGAKNVKFVYKKK